MSCGHEKCEPRGPDRSSLISGILSSKKGVTHDFTEIWDCENCDRIFFSRIYENKRYCIWDSSKPNIPILKPCDDSIVIVQESDNQEFIKTPEPWSFWEKYGRNIHLRNNYKKLSKKSKKL